MSILTAMLPFLVSAVLSFSVAALISRTVKSEAEKEKEKEKETQETVTKAKQDWSDYQGIDTKNGPTQSQSGSDGIGDTQLVISTSNADRYPLMAPNSACVQTPLV
jgi:mannitol-specific phosphotransferase system IIBC component